MGPLLHNKWMLNDYGSQRKTCIETKSCISRSCNVKCFDLLDAWCEEGCKPGKKTCSKVPGSGQQDHWVSPTKSSILPLLAT